MVRNPRLVKWAIAIGVSMAVAVHIVMIAVFLSPPNLVRRSIGLTADRYIGLLFYQNWHLFSPTPGITSTKFAVRCRAQGSDWSGYVDPVERMYAAHYRSRILGYGKVLYVHREVGIGLKQEIDRKRADCYAKLGQTGDARHCAADRVIPTIGQSFAYDLARRYAAQTCTNRGMRRGEVQFKIVEFFPLKYSERDQSDRRWSHVDEMIFPPFVYAQ
jgi:hypothetical protein